MLGRKQFDVILASVAGVNGKGVGERKHRRKMGPGAREEGIPAIKTPIFSSPPTDFQVTQ